MLGYVPEQIFTYMLIFARLGALIMVLPTLGEASIPPRIRLSLALAFSLIMYQVVGHMMPTMPATVPDLMYLLFIEIAVGIFIGGAARLIMSGLQVAGFVIGMQSGLASAQAFDPSQGSQGAILAAFLSVLGVVLIYVSGLYMLFFHAMHDSYTLFPAGGPFSTGDFAEMATKNLASSFEIGMRISAPFLVYGLVFYIGLGLVARLMPQVPIFFVAMPLQIFLSLTIFALVISSGMLWFLDYFENSMGGFLS